MSAKWSRLVAALVMTTVVLVAGSASASATPAQDRPAVGGSVSSQPVEVYDAVLPAVTPVVGEDPARSAASIAHMAAAHVYDDPVVSRVGASVSIPAASPFHQVTAGRGGVGSPDARAEGTSTTSSVLTSTPRGVGGVHASDLVESPLWTATKNNTSAQNAYRHFADHGGDFADIQNSLEYVAKAHDFLRTPPGGTLTRIRANGDVVRWHPGSNTFGVMDAGGAPRTLFKPDPAVHGYPTNWDYFYAQ